MSDIDAKAAAFAVRAEAGELSGAQRAELDAWLAADRRHRGAFLRAQAGLRLFDHGQVVRTMLAPAYRRQRATWLAWGAAATVAVAAAIGAVFILPPSKGDLRTTVGEQRRIALTDGSVAMINTDSRLRVRLEPSERRIVLRQGEAWFQVAKDHSRPFIVYAGRVQVRATGTAFSVRREGAGAEVAVTEGRVVAKRDGDDPGLAISAGEAVFVPDDPHTPARPAVAKVDDILAWKRGEIVLSGETLADAVDEFNRYNLRKIVLRDARSGQTAIIGYFLIDQPEKFALAAARLTGGRVVADQRSIVIENSQ